MQSVIKERCYKQRKVEFHREVGTSDFEESGQMFRISSCIVIRSSVFSLLENSMSSLVLVVIFLLLV